MNIIISDTPNPTSRAKIFQLVQKWFVEDT